MTLRRTSPTGCAPWHSAAPRQQDASHDTPSHHADRMRSMALRRTSPTGCASNTPSHYTVARCFQDTPSRLEEVEDFS
ncbi:MAG: hypothetical protein IJS19_05070 [Muribaculaceae bacterium]|nr:hypothetical protein [Muribaculaceae bacterium]